MSDFLSRASETAEREALASLPDVEGRLIGNILVNRDRENTRQAFAQGYAYAASRLPSEEEIQQIIRDPANPNTRLQARAVRELIEKKMLGECVKPVRG